MNWQLLTGDNSPEAGSWILISDGVDWRRVYVTDQLEFVEHVEDAMCYRKNITHWCYVTLPNQVK